MAPRVSNNVSVLIPAFNAEKYIETAVLSALKQDLAAYEVIVVDDGSVDATARIVESISDSRVVLITKPNEGHASALNTAFSHATGDLIALLDADDAYFPSKLSTVTSIFSDRPAVGMVGHRVIPVDTSLHPIGPSLPARADSGDLRNLVTSQHGTFLHPPAAGMTFRASVANKIFPIPEDLTAFADGFLAGAAAYFAPVAFVAKPLALYRIHETNLSGVIAANEEAVSSRIRQGNALAVSFKARYQTPGQPRAFYTAENELARAILEKADPSELIRIARELPRRPVFRNLAWRSLSRLPATLGHWLLSARWSRPGKYASAPHRSLQTLSSLPKLYDLRDLERPIH